MKLFRAFFTEALQSGRTDTRSYRDARTHLKLRCIRSMGKVARSPTSSLDVIYDGTENERKDTIETF